MASTKTKKAGDTSPPSGAATPADPANPNAPINLAPAGPQSGNIQNVQVDSQGRTLQKASLTVNGKLIELYLNTTINPTQTASLTTRGGFDESDKTVKVAQSFTDVLNSIEDWYGNTSQRQKYINEMYAAGLIASDKSPSVQQVALAWQLVVQEAALQIADPNGDQALTSPDAVLAKAAQQGWNALRAKQAPGDVDLPSSSTGNFNNRADASSQSQTNYLSYVDPASAMGALADSYYRLMGRNPKPEEYQAFLEGILKPYQEAENAGKFETKTTSPNTGQTVDPTTGQPVGPSGSTGGTSTQTNVVAQRNIGTRGLEFLAGQTALSSPESANYQAATTVYNAILSALKGPGAGLSPSGPTTTAP